MTELVLLLDPSMPKSGSGLAPNAGDEIIARAVMRELRSLLPNAGFRRITTHARPTRTEMQMITSADRLIVGGSNLLGNAVRSRRRPTTQWRQWEITRADARHFRRAVLFGTGWRVYEGRVHSSTKRLYRSALSQEGLHSVRDEYTRQKLAEIGITNVVNTGCPTLWPLAGRPDGWISHKRSRSVLTTVTDYRPDPVADAQLQGVLKSMYERVYLWPQGEGDEQYSRGLNANLEVLHPGLEALESFLRSNDCDYVGTRLHGGILCLNAQKRSLVIAVDNRAAEMGPETGLPIAVRGDLSTVREWIESPTQTRISLNDEAITRWREQFQ